MAQTPSPSQSTIFRFIVKSNAAPSEIGMDKSTPFDTVTETIYNLLSIPESTRSDHCLAVVDANGCLQYYFNENNFNLLNDCPVTVVNVPAIKPGSIIDSVNQAINFLIGDSEHEDSSTQMVDLTPLKHLIGLPEFRNEFIEANGPLFLILLAKALSHSAIDFEDDKIEQLWSNLLSIFATLVDFKITDGTPVFRAIELDWNAASDEFISEIMKCPNIEKDWTCLRYCLLILSSIIESCPSRASWIAENEGPEFVRKMSYKLFDKAVEPMSTKIKSATGFLRHKSSLPLRNVRKQLTPCLRLELTLLLANLTYHMALEDATLQSLAFAFWPIVKELVRNDRRREPTSFSREDLNSFRNMELALRGILVKLQNMILSRPFELLPTHLDVKASKVSTLLNDLQQISFREETTAIDDAHLLKLLGCCNPEGKLELEFGDLKYPTLGFECFQALIENRGKPLGQIVRSNLSSSSPILFRKWLNTEFCSCSFAFPIMPSLKLIFETVCTLITDTFLNDSSQSLYPVFFEPSAKYGSPFIGVFLLAFDCFVSTWSTMNAAPDDLKRIAELSKFRLNEIFSEYSSSFEELSSGLIRCTPDSVQRLLVQQKSSMQTVHPAVSELRHYLTKLHTENIQNQRLYMMTFKSPCSYTPTKRYHNKDSETLSVSLSEDHKSLLGRSSENKIVESWPIDHIISVKPGTEDKKAKTPWGIIINFKEGVFDQDDVVPANPQRGRRIVISAASESEYFYWLDGFNVLNKYNRSSKEFAEDLLNLVELELQVRLMGIDLNMVPTTPITFPSTYPPDPELVGT